ncbi:hypothetical protein [Dysgonomonas sp. GY617]|uniref:hypothetical protein n=1 Tax=Dysgonomonas sp. GY617 TaxID=2780420 RepID=UPI001883722B|nr:hypothetical protein [Dysgonomonas sp. GY617]MBF0576538.1 hypothetical protein [Dysgonomonas sp. GY617]
MKKLIVTIILIMPLLFACSNDNEFSVIAVQKFYITDIKGNDLLNPNTENAINIDRIKIYYLIDGNKIECSKYNAGNGYSLDYPKGYRIYSPEELNEKQYTMVLFLNNEVTKDNFSYTYIEFNEDRTDTIKSIVKRETNILSCIMTSYNDSIWNPTGDNPTFTIIK